MSDYSNYQSMLTSVVTGMEELRGICDELSMSSQAEDISQARRRLQDHVFSVGIMGEFRRGKSTVINALLGQDVVPADIVPCSATLNYVRWGADKYAEIHFKDGRVQKVAVEQLSDYVTKLTAESTKMAESVEHAVVYYPSMFCQNGVQIVDTPGLNDDERMTAISENVIPTLDAIIMVIVPGSPFGSSEAEFVRNKVMTSDLGRILFVVNKIDLVDEGQRARLLKAIKEKIQESVMEKIAAVYGKDSTEYKETENKIGQIRLLPVSARNALRGKTRNDSVKLQESGYPEFEAMLSRLLTEERGMLELIHPINKVYSTARETLNTIDMRLNAMQMESAEYEKVQRESMSKIKEDREKKKEEIKLLKAKSKSLYADLMTDLGTAYTEVESMVNDYIRNIPIIAEDIESDETVRRLCERIEPQINQKIEDVLSIQTERLINAVQDRLGDDVQELEKFSKEFAADMSNIRTRLSLEAVQTDGSNGSGVRDALIDSAVIFAGANFFGSVIPGAGGLLAGWREHGWKGAAVGGLSGFGIGLGSLFLGASLGIVGLPLALIMGVASTFGGKKITDLVFGKKRPEPTVPAEIIRDKLLEAAGATIKEMQRTQILEKWLRNACDEAYASVADNIDQEWEGTLKTMENSLTQIQIDLQKNITEKEKMKQDMLAYQQKIQSVMKTLDPIYQKLVNGLNISAGSETATQLV